MRAALTKGFFFFLLTLDPSHQFTPLQPNLPPSKGGEMACLDLLRSSSTLIRPSHPSQMAGVFTMRFASQGGFQLNVPPRPSAAS